MSPSIGAIRDGRKLVTTAGTRVQLADSGATGAVSVVIQALGTNTGNVVVGSSVCVAAPGTQGTPTQRGILLKANDSISLDVSDLGEIWLDSVTSGDGVVWIVGAS